MSLFHKKNLTRGQKWRSTIIFVEIMVLMLAIFINNSQENSPTISTEIINETVVQDYLFVPTVEDNSIGHRMAFYVDYHYQVKVLDNGVLRDFAQFDDCPTRFQKIESEARLEIDSHYRAISLTLGTILHGVSFYAESYEVYVGETYVSLITNRGGEYRISTTC